VVIPCPICRRSTRGFAYNPKLARQPGQPAAACCSQHLELAIKMIDTTEYEREAIAHGGSLAGEYLETLGKTDLAVMTPQEYDAFNEVAITGYVERLGEIADHLAAAAARMSKKVTAADIPY
jgi:hypothetical protein